ncbi:uncharacterized protein LAESUDRAFT_451686 [Laetiporus sulphureus 93-53]|uniref:Uncharacterized protein n=1 Tax=Laetiporus sulphureus 93-53 TaxID=1314785 RepID=A0A165BXH1_9APHY|nr:uncharacterized protein LAESUDRAFT_451686 [Laetiporus sulphureus 93-53]KZT01832.1 hypothetical protein LAESUDRAFT_451686 [Laetiporus sulphureus 93-53]
MPLGAVHVVCILCRKHLANEFTNHESQGRSKRKCRMQPPAYCFLQSGRLNDLYNPKYVFISGTWCMSFTSLGRGLGTFRDALIVYEHSWARVRL